MPFFMWLLPLSFFTYQFILRLWPGLMMDQIMEQFSIDAKHFGVMAALYYYGYSGMQIPVAILLERFKVRYVVFVFALLCGSATMLLTYTNNWYLACLSRFLVGAGSAAGFLSVSKVISEWFSKDQYAKIVGFSFTIGLMGAIYGGKPISLLIESYSWQKVALVLAVVSIIIGMGNYFALRSPRNLADQQTNDNQFKMANFKAILSSPLIWLLAFANFLMVGSLEGFADVWGIPYLMAVYHFTKADSAQLTSFIFFGMLVGGPLLALLSKKLGNYVVVGLCGLGMAFIFILLLSASNIFNWWSLAGLLFVIGIMCCYQVIVFAAGADLVEHKYLGVTIAFLNSMNMLGGSFFHTSIGIIMDMFGGNTGSQDGIRQYSIESYQYALMLIPICAICGFVITCFISFKKKQRNIVLGDI
jgi:MFS family permease